jgi:tetratricopeptide (TPR) repeat protein
MGVKQYKQGHIQAARNSFEKALRDEPGNAFAHYFLSNCLGKQGHGPQALAQYERAKELSSYPQLQEYCDQAINHYETQELKKDYYAKASQQANKLAAKVAPDLAAQRMIKQQLYCAVMILGFEIF